MKTLRNLGLIGLLGLASACGSEDHLVKENNSVRSVNLCKIANFPLSSSTESVETNAIDNDGDGNYDEAFVTRGYVNVNLGVLVNNQVAKATTHYVAQGVEPNQQKYTGFPDTKPMTPEYQRALKLVCNPQ